MLAGPAANLQLIHGATETFPAGAVDDDVDVCSLFGRMLDPVQVFDQVAAQAALSDDVIPLFGGT